jgi:uncharacterized SAM-binding protein YcdF (DUF218 family)
VDVFAVKAFLKALLLPPTGLLLLALAGLVVLGRRPRLGRALALAGVLGVLVLSMPIVAAALHRAWNPDLAPLDLAAARTAQALVIVGTGVRGNAAEYGGDTLGAGTLERVRYGARIARETGLPVLVSGGSVRGSTAEADLMRGALQQEFHVPVRWVENGSRDTHENAVRTAAVLRAAGVRTVVLVSHSIDMPRTCAEFRAAGLTPIPAPILLPPAHLRFYPADFLPTIGALGESWRVIYEAVAEAVRRIGVPLG